MGRGRSGSKSARKTDEDVYREQYRSDKQQIDAFLETKGDYNSLEVNGQIFEKYGTQRAFIQMFKDATYGDDEVGNDDAWAFEYNDGTVAVYGSGDSLRGVRLRGIRNAIYENASTTAFYGRDIEITDYSIKSREWQREHLSQTIGKPGPKGTPWDYNIDWRVSTKRL